MGDIHFYQNDPDKNRLSSIVNWIIDITLAIVLAVFLIQNIGQRISIEGRSMEPTLESGDLVLVDQISYLFFSPKRYDLIAFEKEGTSSGTYVKRIIGLPGEVVQIIDGVVYIDGEPIDILSKGDIALPGLAEKPIQLGKKEYFLLGDSTDSSEDSRFSNIGNVFRDEFLGRVWFRVSPLERMGFLAYKEE